MDATANEVIHHRAALGAASAGVGAVVWLAAPSLPVGAPPPPGSVGHLFLLMPLVATPLALDLLARSWTDTGGAPSRLHQLARWLQPFAAGLLLSSFCIPAGAAAGALGVPWLGMALMVATAGVTGVRRLGGVRAPNISLLAAQVFLPVGALWLILSRLGISPRGLSPLFVLLAALHFHFNGFTAQILIGATGRQLTRASSGLVGLHRLVTGASIAGLLLLAAGKVLAVPAVRMAGVAAIGVSFLGLSVTTTAVAAASRSAVARHLLLASAASVAAAIVLAGIYGIGELVGRDFISIGRMVATHGLLMLAFTLCGLVGWLRLRHA